MATKPASGTGLDTGGAYYSALTNAKGAVYGMLEGSGSTSADSSGNGRTLTLDTTAVTGVTWSTNGSGDAILVAGGSTTAGLTMASAITFASASQFSVAFRATVSVTATLYALFGNNNSANYFLADDANFGDYGSVSGNSFIFTGSGATDWHTDADWFLVVDGVGLKVHLFHNGVEVGDSPKTITAGDASWAMGFLAGGYASGSLAQVGTFTYLYVLPGLVGTATDAAYFHGTPYGIFAAGGGTVYNVSVTETGSATETDSSALTTRPSVSESGSAADTNSSAATFIASASEVAVGSDIQTNSALYSSSFVEAATATDTNSSAAIFARSVSESGVATDTISSVGTFGSSISEAGVALDTVSCAAIFASSVSETCVSVDTVANGNIFLLSCDEAAVASDSVSCVAVFVASDTESASASEAVSSSAAFSSAVIETGSASSQESASATFSCSISESGSAADVVTIIGGTVFNVSVVEACTALDAPTAPTIACDCPAVYDVRAGVVYGNGLYIGTLGRGSYPVAHHSPADVLRWGLVNSDVLGLPNVGVWPGFADYEPATPDECVTVYDTQGRDDGREMNTGGLYSHHGIQVRIRSKGAPTGWEKAEQIRIALAESFRLTDVTVDGILYQIQAVTHIGQAIPLGKETPTAKGRYAFTINATISLKKHTP